MSKIAASLSLSAVFALAAGLGEQLITRYLPVATQALYEQKSNTSTPMTSLAVKETRYPSQKSLFHNVVIEAEKDFRPHKIYVHGDLILQSLRHNGGDLEVTGDTFAKPLIVRGDATLRGYLMSGAELMADNDVFIAKTGNNVQITSGGDVTIENLGANSVVQAKGRITITQRIGAGTKLISAVNDVVVRGCYEQNPPANGIRCVRSMRFNLK